MSALVAAVPLLTVGVAVLGFRRTPLEAGALGTIAAVAVVAAMRTQAIAIGSVLAGTTILAASAGCVLLPGLMFLQISQRRGAAAALAEWMQAIPAPAPAKAAILVVGLAPFVESLTGFGVCLVVVIPAALAFLPRETALKTALVSVNVMPWGTLGLATLVGAGIAGVPANVLGLTSAFTSAPVFPAAAVVATGLASGWQLGWQILGAVLGITFVGLIVAANAILGPAIAGVAAGGGAMGVGLCALRLAGWRLPRLPTGAWPFAVLIILAGLHRILLQVVPTASSFEIGGGGVTWEPLTSPGLALLTAMLLTARYGSVGADLTAGVHRAVKPVCALTLFLLLAQIMNHAGLIQELARVGHRLSGGFDLAVTAAAGAVSGYVSGSNVAGNALLMGSAQAFGADAGAGVVFAAVQNSAAGHAVLASGPIVAMLAGLAQATAPEQTRVLRFGLWMAALNALLIWLAGSVASGVGALG
ncbi:hypothetical protein CKO28_20890 [Rhodovibrio sodomensis]|uniref:L-lactate permease n=1 Tax=Rhodovibrio sodomensis TaxID=1088 RepID=A0ABS1DJ39_9PROT|nr:L-lactate permease [Rhodovibrio sodomensis]MBK1670485.1 hypothetical protein [Rhodovibrio sodomensis]